MSATPLLATKLYIPPPRPKLVPRPRLIDRLNEAQPGHNQAFGRKLTLISAPAGFGKTTLVSEWVAGGERLESKARLAWLSLDEGDNDPARFLAYLIAALQTVAARIGSGVLSALQAPQPPPIEMLLTALLNEITTLPDSFILVLDDYHVIDTQPVEAALTFLLEHLPPQMHLVIATRQDPHLPLARLRARGQLTELRLGDLRFTPPEAAEFLNRVMGLDLSAEDVHALETRTEGWIAGLQLAALSMQGRADTASFIKSFTGSHHFVLDYLVEEVLGQLPESLQTFLLRTSVLDRLCGPLCDALLGSAEPSGQATLQYLEHANLFVVPLDDERRWYRYHHLFADLLRQRLLQSAPPASASQGGIKADIVADLHIRASQWYEDNNLEIEAFQHAAAAKDIERAERLIDGKGMPLHYRGAMAPVIHWLGSLPAPVLDARPSLWVTYASATMNSGHPSLVEPKLQAAEAALSAQTLPGSDKDGKTRDLMGQIAAIRALVAASQNQVATIIAQSHRALEFLLPDNLPARTTATLALGFAYQLQGDRLAAIQAYTDVIAISQASGNFLFTIAAASSLGGIQFTGNQLHEAGDTYRFILRTLGDPDQWLASEAHLGLARIFYEWNDLEAAEQHGRQYVRLAQQLECDTIVSGEVLLARLKLARGDLAAATDILAAAGEYARQHNYAERLLEVAATQVIALLRQGDHAGAAHLAHANDLPLSQARVNLARGDISTALSLLEPFSRQAEANGCQDELLKCLVLQALAHAAQGDEAEAIRILAAALSLAEPGGFIRTFVDEGASLAKLLSAAAARGIMPDYAARLLAAFEAEAQLQAPVAKSVLPPVQPLIEPLSQRELEVLRLISQGLSNREISERLFLALSTVKGHNRVIFDKLQVQRRTEAVARARQLGLL